MPEIKQGDTKVFDIAGQKLVVEPTAYGNLKKILKIIEAAAAETQKADGTAILSIPVLFERYVDEFVPLLFKKATHPWLDRDWIDENLTLPLMIEIVQAAAAVNGLKDFFGRGGKAPAPAAEEAIQPQEPTPAIQ